MNAALTQVSALFRAASELNLNEDGLRVRFNHLVSFSVRDAHLRRAKPGEPDGTQRYGDGLPDVQSRMGAFMSYPSSYFWFDLISSRIDELASRLSKPRKAGEGNTRGNTPRAWS